MTKYRIAVVPGDGIGKEIVPEGLRCLDAVAQQHGFGLEYTEFPWGAGHYHETGAFMAADGLETLKAFDAIYFGAVGLPEVDDTLPAQEFTFKIRKAFVQYVNFRPTRLLPGVTGPLRDKTEKDIDFIVLRENTEGEFVQVGDQFHPEAAHGFATDTSVFTRKGIERIAHYAFRLAQGRRKRVTNVTKSNTLIHSLRYWDQVIEETSRAYPDVTLEKLYVDNASASFVLRPERFDVVLTTNMIGDILSDLGGAIMGSLGLGASGNINPEKDYPSMFEPIHGSAPDISGRGIANPIGAIWSGALMLAHLGQQKASDSIVNAIESTLHEGNLTIDLGGQAKTQDVVNSVVANIEQKQLA